MSLVFCLPSETPPWFGKRLDFFRVFWLLFLIRLYLTSSLHSPLGIKFLSVKFKLGFALPRAFHLVLINDNGKVVAREVVELIALEHLRRLVRMQIAQCHLQLSSSSSPPYDSSPLPYLPSDSALQFGSELFSEIGLPGDPSLLQLVQNPLHFVLLNLSQHLLAGLAGFTANLLLFRFNSCSYSLSVLSSFEISSSKSARSLSFSLIFISTFSSTFSVSMSHLPLLHLCLSVNIASWPPFIILQTLAPRIVFLAVLSPQFSGVDMSSSSTTQSVSWTSAPDQELNQAPQVCNSHHPLSSTLSAQTLLSSPLPTFTAQDSFLFFTKAYWITGIFLGMSCVFIKCLLWATSFPALLIVLPVTAALTHHHLLLGPGILARHQINSKVWKKTNLKIIR